MTPIHQLLTVKQVAERLQSSTGYVYKLIDRGGITFIDLNEDSGRKKRKKACYRFDPADVDEFIRGRKIEGNKPKSNQPRLTLKHIKLN